MLNFVFIICFALRFTGGMLPFSQPLPPRLRISLTSLALGLGLGIWLWLGFGAPANALPWGPRPVPPTATPGQQLQEVAPPGGAQQLALALADRHPRLELLAPSNDSLLGAGPWALGLRLQDWPLGERPDLGPGPHLVVLVDDNPPLRIFARPAGNPESWEIPMGALSPGSHRITAFAALPWGEAVADPEARAQLLLHRTARNPLALPDPEAAQLIAVPSPQLAAGAPVPLNWLLLNAPLQNLRPEDSRWRLRLSLDGASVLLDRADPVWVAPLSIGSHALQLELLDPLGNPLGAPFNSLVRELTVPPRSPAPPGMLRNQLSARELEALINPEYQEPPYQEPKDQEPTTPASAAAKAGPPSPPEAQPEIEIQPNPDSDSNLKTNSDSIADSRVDSDSNSDSAPTAVLSPAPAEPSAGLSPEPA